MSTDTPHLIRIDNQEIRPIDGKIIIGRHPACDFVIAINDKNIGISGRHASIVADGNSAWLEDLGSTNGTYVQGQRIAQRTRLAAGERFRLDSLEFEFRTAASVQAAPAPPDQVERTLLASRQAPPTPVLAKTVEVKTLDIKAPPPPIAAPVPAAAQKVAGAWISADPAGKTKFLLPEERARMREQMGSGLYTSMEAVSTPTLIITAPEQRRVALAQRDSATQEWTIGANADADVSITLDGVSGLHAKILRHGQTWTISDLMSANGTFVDGQKINRSHLQSGSQLGFGPVLCTLLLPEGAVSAAAPQATGDPGGKRLPLLIGSVLLALAVLGGVLYWLLGQD